MSDAPHDSFPPQPPAAQPTWERATLEKIAMAAVREQAAARRWKMLGRMAWLAFFAVVAWALLMRASPDTKKLASPHTALVEIRGEIADGNDASVSNLLPAIKEAFEDSGSQAVVLHINSGGGSPVQAGILADELVRLKGLHKKPLYAVVGDMCASGAYYIAVAADTIYVDKASMVGSIGVRMDSFGFTGAMDKLGVERRLLTAGSNKGFLDPFSPMNEAQKAHAQAMLDNIHQQFIGTVRTLRGKRLKETPEMFSGLFWTGQQAITLGLADELGSTDSVARDVVKQERVVDYTRRDNVAEKLVKKFGASVGEGAARSMLQQPLGVR